MALIPTPLGNVSASPPLKTATRIVIADDHQLFRECFSSWLHTEGFDIIGCASNGEDALDLSLRLMPDILLLDLCMPRLDGLQVLHSFQKQAIQVPVILLCGAIQPEEVVSAIRLGVRGIVRKCDASESLLNSIQKVKEGGYWMGDHALTSLVHAVSDEQHEGVPGADPYGLTRREYDVIFQILKGFSNLEIAESLDLSGNTVKHHITHIFDKLGVFSRLELALFASNHQMGNSRS